MNKQKEPDLEFVRLFNFLGDESIAFWKDEDHLEIQTVNLDNDSMLIILNPNEIKQLKELLEKL